MTPKATYHSLVPIQEGGSGIPFFCVHGVGGYVLNYRTLSQKMGIDQPFYGLIARGLDGHSSPLERIEDMAASYLQEIRMLQPQGPYCFGGASFGGLVAFELARQAASQGQPVGIVALFDSPSPLFSESLPHLIRRKIDVFYRRAKLNIQSVMNEQNPAVYIRKKLKTIRRHVKTRIWRSAFGTFKTIGAPVPTRLLIVKELNWNAMRKYVPGSYSGRVTVFRARIRTAGGANDDTRGWQNYAAGGVEVVHVPGDHLTMLQEPYVAEVARELKQRLTDIMVL